MHIRITTVALALGLIGLTGRAAPAQLMSKPQVANLIKNVENGVDEFRDYLDKRGENAGEAASAATSSGRRTRSASSSQKSKATAKKDALDDALGDLNKSTNRLRRKFDATDTWMETKGQVQSVLDDARKINPALARGSYGPEAARLWAVLRTGINDLARAYGVPPLAP
jgi:parvulin-like peptidyl-prolyl isomerase